MTYQTPVRDMHFLLENAAGFDAVRKTGAFDDLSADLIEAVLAEVGKFADDVVAPLNRVSDTEGARLENGKVFTPSGFQAAYDQYVEAGWNALAFPEEFGGQGLPQSLALLVSDALFAACLSFSMGTCLTTGAVKALLAYGSDEQKALYLPKMVSGEWTGTMNLTEPHAGSDLSGLKTKATPRGDGTYEITGNKIYISFGDHDLAENICHLVLARLPDAPEGTRGISMFLVPKYLVKEDGSLGAFNNVRCIGIEHKMGQHGSPTCSLAYGEGGPSIGTLVGKEHEGLRNMFVMMNAARIDVGMQGVAVAERAFQQALAFAQERKQGRPFGVKSGDVIPISGHADVRRNLMTMKALTEAGRAICYANMVAYDVAHQSPEEATARAAKEREELLTPISKGFGTDRAIEVANIGIQVHGGMGFVEETGAAQHYRDVRIAAIYEGTNGIQAIDLAGRKLGMGSGKLAYDFLDEVEALAAELAEQENAELSKLAGSLAREALRLRETTEYMVSAMSENTDAGLAGATPYLDQFGYVAGGFYLARAAQAAMRKDPDDAYHRSKLQIAAFYMDNILPRASGLAPAVLSGADAIAPIEPSLLAG
jgi:alkylation response protein AidB-like acyl-CoA dehydrogenase